jgi:hypothetical protein
MASTGSTRGPRERRAVVRSGRGVATGLIIGAVVGLAAGAAIGGIAFAGGAALLAAALGGTIFGGVVGAFVGGMSTLEDPPPGAEPGLRDQPLERHGLTHDEREP